MPKNRSNRNHKPQDCGKGKPKSEDRRRPKYVREEDEVTSGTKVPSINDWRWYSANEQLVKDVASLPFTYPLGGTIDFTGNKQPIDSSAFPGIMTIHYVPSMGWTEKASDPVNLCAINMYSWIRHENSGGVNYREPDLFMYLGAVDSAMAFLAWMKRVYGVMMTYSNVNRYFPAAAIRAMNVDFNDIQSKMADFRAFINVYATRLNSLCTPANLPYNFKHQWMASGIYTDAPTEKPQTYLFNPDYLFKFGYDSDGAGCLKVSHRIADYAYPLDFDEIRNIAAELLDPIIGDEDFGVISGDILKAYGAAGVVRSEGIHEDYAVVPGYSEDVLDQIQNATLMGDVIWLDDNGTQTTEAIYQSASKLTIVSHPCSVHPYAKCPNTGDYNGVTPARYAWSMKRILNFDRPSPTPGMVIDATRLTNIGTLHGSKLTIDGVNYNIWEIRTAGSEIVTKANIWVFEQGTLLKRGPFYVGYSEEIRSSLITSVATGETPSVQDILDADEALFEVNNTMNTAAVANFSRALDLFTNFSRPPYLVSSFYTLQIMEEYNSNYDPPVKTTSLDMEYGKTQGYFGTVDTYTVVGKDDLMNLSEAALLSEFAIKSFGTKTI